MKWNAEGEAESAPNSYRVKEAGYMESLSMVSQDILIGAYSWFNYPLMEQVAPGKPVRNMCRKVAFKYAVQ